MRIGKIEKEGNETEIRELPPGKKYLYNRKNKRE